MPKTTRDQLVLLAFKGNERLVRYIASRLADEDEARDIAQEAYLRMLRLDRHDLIRHPEAYLFRIAANLVHEHRLKQTPRLLAGAVDGFSDPDDAPAATQSPDEGADELANFTLLSEALASLPPVTRAVVVMHRRDGYTYEQIGATVGLSRDMVKKHLLRGLTHCRRAMVRLRSGQ